MMWLEVIHIRVANHDLERVTALFVDLLNEIHEKHLCQIVKLFKRADLKTDICFHLYHDLEKMTVEGSPVGLRLAETLKTFGMVHHTVWSESEQMRSQDQVVNNPGQARNDQSS